MDVSVVLARLFGLYLVVMGLFWVTKREFLTRVTEDFANSPALVVVSGAVSLLVGLLVLLVHPVLSWDWRGGLTVLLGCVPVIKGVVTLFVMDVQVVLMKILTHGKAFYPVGVVLVLLGLFFSYYGFVVS